MKKILRSVLRFLLRLYPLYGGVTRLMNSAPVKWLTNTPEIVTTRLRSGEWIVVDIKDYCGRFIYFWGDYDPRVTWLAVETLKPGETFLDIGANYGEIGIAAASKVGPRGEVHAFEPNARIAGYLRRSAELNNFTQLHIHEVALADQDGEAELGGPAGNAGAASLHAVRDAEIAPMAASQGTVTVRDARQYLRQAVRGRIAAIKIDVEGMEAPILMSMEDVLRQDRPRRICFESHPDGVPFPKRRVVQYLKRIGYQFWQIEIRFSLQLRPNLLPVPESGETADGYDFVAEMR